MTSKSRLTLAASMAAFAVVCGGSAGAVTLLYDPGSAYSEMLHNDSYPTGLTVTLKSQPSGDLVDLTADAILDPGGAGNGFATVDGPFSWLIIDPEDPLGGFTRIGFTLNPQSKFNGSNLSNYAFFIDVNFLGGGTTTLSAFAPSFNKYDILADGDEIISSLRLYGLSGDFSGGGHATGLTFDDIRQISFDTVASAIPEPGTWGMMLIGLFSAGLALRAAQRRSTLGAPRTLSVAP
jgi:hypothetical protein